MAHTNKARQAQLHEKAAPASEAVNGATRDAVPPSPRQEPITGPYEPFLSSGHLLSATGIVTVLAGSVFRIL